MTQFVSRYCVTSTFALAVLGLVAGCAHSPTDLPEVPDEMSSGQEVRKPREPVIDYGEDDGVPYSPTTVDRSELVDQAGEHVPMATFVWAPKPARASRVPNKSTVAPTNTQVALEGSEGVVHHYLMLSDGKMVRLSHKLSEHGKCTLCTDND